MALIQLEKLIDQALSKENVTLHRYMCILFPLLYDSFPEKTMVSGASTSMVKNQPTTFDIHDSLRPNRRKKIL